MSDGNQSEEARESKIYFLMNIFLLTSLNIVFIQMKLCDITDVISNI